MLWSLAVMPHHSVGEFQLPTRSRSCNRRYRPERWRLETRSGLGALHTDWATPAPSCRSACWTAPRTPGSDRVSFVRPTSTRPRSRQNKGYAFRVPTVADAEWMINRSAGAKIGVYRSARDHSRAAAPGTHREARRAVTSRSIGRSLVSGVGSPCRAWLFVRDCASALLRGI